jgi:DNA-directed RNA polymerase specialized sigma subunit
MSTTYKRNGNRWTINEILTLQREYELLEWSVYKIAEKHQRTVMAILCKLKAEQFISHFKEARGFDVEEYKKSIDESYNCQNNIEQEEDTEDEDDAIKCCAEDDEYVPEDIYEDDDEEDNDYDYEVDEVEQLTDRVWSIQTSVNEISSIVKSIFGLLSSKSQHIESEL